ncbi:hypothetical protein ACVGVM_21575 [Pseudonocardia bannensis]|uniref:hypothetical protein n=1 Tax=Pseudonocardia bannensis TaxID=630973 RepID=UPI001FE343C2|nr:hypothetical protein [Pseudonocardia bannensis]
MSGAEGGQAGDTVVVVGAINVDFVVPTDRLPGPGETVVDAGLVRHGGGKGANAAADGTDRRPRRRRCPCPTRCSTARRLTVRTGARAS